MTKDSITDDSQKDQEQRERTFNDLTASEWTKLSRNVWRDLSSAREDYHKEHGATFSEKLAKRLIKIYSGSGDLILDPFVGTGTTVISAKQMDRSGIGIELTEEFVDTAREQLKQSALGEFGSGSDLAHEIIHDDCRNVRDHVEDNSVQAVITSPPYANLIHKAKEDRETREYSIIEEENNSQIDVYSDSDQDFGNLSYDRFLNDLETLMQELYETTKPGGYNIWIVKDFRDTENDIPYVPLHSDVADRGKKAGFKYHDMIVWDQNQHRRLVLLGYPSTFYTNQNSSFFVVLRKPE